MEQFTKAFNLAIKAHDGQLDKGGLPYILHPIRIAEQFNDEDFKIVSILHDIVEDTSVSMEEIYNQFGTKVGDGVNAMTKTEKQSNGRAYSESYREYLDRVSTNRLAKQIKLADMIDNSSVRRMEAIPIEKRLRLVAKYTRGRHYLLTGEWHESEALDIVIKAGYKK
jgi:(p)ppGpp synthase/HD superfamily hydrolase